MTELSQVRWAFECAETANVAAVLTSVKINEALSELYEIVVTLRTSPSVRAEDLLGKDSAVVFGRSEESARTMHGLITRVDVEAFDATDLETGAAFELFIRPAMWMLTLQRDSRIFQDQSVPEIVEKVLGEALAPYERAARVELEGEYPKRVYCVQYQETNYEFVARLLAEEGIRFSFVQGEEEETVVLRDRNASYARVPTLPEPGVLSYNAGGHGVPPREWLRRLLPILETTTTGVAIRDSDFTRNGLVFEEQAGAPDALGRDRVSHEHGSARSVTIFDYEEGVRRYQRHDAKQQASVRLEEKTRDEWVGQSASSHAAGLEPGSIFAVEGFGLPLESEFLVTRVSHMDGIAIGDQMGPGGGYLNVFDCIPITKEYRPSRDRPKPRIPSVQTAVVTGPAGEEIHVDEYGRVKVQFYWDREGQLDERTSCWVRTQQAWAGNGFGAWWVPRMGMEVIVQFVDGDPDRPMVTGCVYNADNALPYALPDEKTKSTIKSNSTLGGGGFNELRFEDKAGAEEVWLHAQKDLNEKVLHDHTLSVGRHETIGIGVNRTIDVGAHFRETIGGSETRSVRGASTESIGGGETRSIKGGSSTTVEGGVTTTVIGGVTRSTVGPTVEEYAGGITRTIVGDYVLDIPVGNFKVQCGKTSIEIKDGEIILNSPTNVVITGGTGVAVTATGGDVAVKGGPNIKLNCA